MRDDPHLLSLFAPYRFSVQTNDIGGPTLRLFDMDQMPATRVVLCL